MRTVGLGLTAILLILAGCSEWPRSANLPEEGDLQPGSVSPQSLVAVDWTESQEGQAEENDLPTSRDVAAQSLALGEGLLLDAGLAGTGWSNSRVPDAIEAASCAGSVGKRTAQDDGDYLGDVDFFVVIPEADGTLCAAVETSNDQMGWDLVLLELDDCNIPVGPVLADGVAVGIDLGGLSGDWAATVTSGKHYGVAFAGYYPNDLEVEIDYALGISLVPSDGEAPGRCPLLPGGG